MTFERGWWLAFVVAPAALLLPDAAHADDGTHIPGRHVDALGRVLQANCPAELTAPGEARCYSHRIIPDQALQPLAMPGGLGGNQLASAYNIPSTAVSHGAIVAIVDVGGDTTALSDLQTYRNTYTLGTMDACTSTLPVSGSATPCLARCRSNALPWPLPRNAGSTNRSSTYNLRVARKVA